MNTMRSPKPTFLKVNGKREFVVLTYREYVAIVEALEDAADRATLKRARKFDAGKPLMTIEQTRAELKKRASRGPSKRGRAAGMSR